MVSGKFKKIVINNKNNAVPKIKNLRLTTHDLRLLAFSSLLFLITSCSSHDMKLSGDSYVPEKLPEIVDNLDEDENEDKKEQKTAAEKTEKEPEYNKTFSIFEPRKPTPPRFFSADISMPTKFATTNNLVKKVGEFYRSYGEVIFLQGTITDSFGVPIEGAIVEIWQTNAAGKYHTLLEPDSEYVDKYFSMSGRATSDNLGNYHFITIMPGANPGRAPHINMNIYHPKFGKLETEMYFPKHPYNKTDYQYLSYSEEEKKLVTAAVRNSDIMDPKSNKLFTFNIVMQGVHQYKGF